MDQRSDTAEVFIKADEVDEGPRNPDILEGAEAEGLPVPALTSKDRDGSAVNPSRPLLRHDKWMPAPQQPAPPAPLQIDDEVSGVEDSLSLRQLKKLVSEMPKVQATPYAFTYEDTSSFEEEFEEFFGYSAEERAVIVKTQIMFAYHWEEFRQVDKGSYLLGKVDYMKAQDDVKDSFLRALKNDLRGHDSARVLSSLKALVYLALGCWIETAGNPQPAFFEEANGMNKQPKRYKNSRLQIRTIRQNIHAMSRHSLIEVIYSHLQLSLSSKSNPCIPHNSVSCAPPESDSWEESWCCLVLMHLFVDGARREARDFNIFGMRDEILVLRDPEPFLFITRLVADMRWDDRFNHLMCKILLLYWKIILLTLGGLENVKHLKNELNRIANPQDDREDDDEAPTITASPLDYHVFRQEITSKYPAFNPPQPLFPFEPESNSIIPTVHDQYRYPNRAHIGAGPANINGTNSSIFHQPVHIATPAPSPPPSPVGPGGKGLKKQNYQTNQMFPFLYPPLDASSNNLGGKGQTEVQDALVGRKWQGSDVPVSILEAADIFAKRMRATRAMKQLWEERIRFMKFERGNEDVKTKADNSMKEEARKNHLRDEKGPSDADKHATKVLDDVERLYRDSLPHFQSIVAVLMKVLLQTVTTLVTQQSAPGQMQNGFQSDSHDPDSDTGGMNGSIENNNEAVVDDLDTIRSQEITGKAVSGILILLLKWFKISHVLKAEYLSQVLLDSNYVQLVLKLFTHQELERVVNYRCERREMNFFRFCRKCQKSSRQSDAQTIDEDDEDSEDDSIPQPISQTGTDLDGTRGSIPLMETRKGPPQVDELGYALSDVPMEPITNFSWRNFFSNINHLRILQKIVKHHRHRQLMMVQFKYSNILKKSLRVPQPEIRLYTLKIIKGQIPYCHRKWRQGNMRIITAIYLHCKPELRDEWLAGVDIDQEMSEATPLEQALRSLTYWYNLKTYPGTMWNDQAKTQGLLDEEQDFFVGELDKMDALVGSFHLDDMQEEADDKLEAPIQIDGY